MPSVILKKGRERRLYAGHSWVYAGEIDKITSDPKDGDVVDIAQRALHDLFPTDRERDQHFIAQYASGQ